MGLKKQQHPMFEFHTISFDVGIVCGVQGTPKAGRYRFMFGLSEVPN